MKKRLFIFVLLVFCLPVFLLAQTRVVDNAGLLSGGDRADLERQLAEIASTYNFDLVIVTENSIGSASPSDFADNFFDRGGYGKGADRDGCLFLIVTGIGEFWFSTSGRGIRIFTDNDTAYRRMQAGILQPLMDNDIVGTYRAFISIWEEFLALDAKGRNYNFFHQWNTVLVIIAWVISLLIGFIVVQTWKAQMNTALPKKEADIYIIPNSLAFTSQKERFLYSSVTKTKRETSSSSSSGRGGRHISTSGRSHGGRGGKFR